MIAAVKAMAAAQSRFVPDGWFHDPRAGHEPNHPLILFLHNRYRTSGGEERAVAELMTLVRDELGEEAELLERDSAQLGRGRAARGLLRGGLDPEDVGAAVRRSNARIVHAHNLNPSFGPRALHAAKRAGAKVVLHLHNYRLVCAVGTCFNSKGEDCVRCKGRHTSPGVRLNCRGESRAEALSYAIALARHQRALVDAADVIVVPSEMAAFRLKALKAPLTAVHVVGHVVRDFAARSTAAQGTYALVASRLAPEKGVETAIEACRRAGVELVVAGDGPHRLPRDQARFVGRVGDQELADLRAGAALGVVPSRAFETFGLAAAEAMAAGLPVVATHMGALTELVEPDGLVAPNDPEAMAKAIEARFGDERAGDRAITRARATTAPAVVAPKLAAAYEAAAIR
jgi:glycosyltransferase involved in cell wall biosynthesis